MKSQTIKPAEIASAQLTPQTPNTGAYPSNQVSICVTPLNKNGKPPKTPERTSSLTNQRAGNRITKVPAGRFAFLK